MRFAVENRAARARSLRPDFHRRVSPVDARPRRRRSDWQDIVQQAQAVEAAGATLLNTGIGWHEARIPTIATSVPRAAFAA
jgi:2,4-dienoyl-CoA reductase (NADPH2)